MTIKPPVVQVLAIKFLLRWIDTQIHMLLIPVSMYLNLKERKLFVVFFKKFFSPMVSC